MNTDELIRGYFNETLSQDDQRIYLDKYENDAEFKVQADQLEVEIMGIREAGRKDLKNKFSNWDAEVKNENANSNSAFGSYIKYGIAASVIIAIGLYFFIPNSNEDLFVAYYEPYENFEHTATRDDLTGIFSVRDSAYFSYDQKNYKIADNSFSKLLDSNFDDTAALFFRGMSRLELGNYGGAVEDFELVSSTEHEYYKDAAIWYLALINIKLEKPELSVKLLKRLHFRKGGYQERALELSSKL